jgi:lysozyme family protein
MADSKIAIAVTLVHEGGYVNNPNDSGGETYRGISRVNHPDWSGWAIIDSYKNRPDFPAILDSDQKLQDLIVSEYEEGYWKNLYSQIRDQFVANKLFDLGVLFGVGTAVKVMQGIFSMHGVIADGIFGPHTLDLVNTAEPVGLLTAYKTSMVSHAVNIVAANPQDRVFFAGWVRRINS